MKNNIPLFFEKTSLTKLRSRFYQFFIFFYFFLLFNNSLLIGQTWEILQLRGNITANQEKLKIGERFSERDIISFSSTTDVMAVISAEMTSRKIRLVQPNGFTSEENQGKPCLARQCRSVWVDPQIFTNMLSGGNNSRIENGKTIVKRSVTIVGFGSASYEEEIVNIPANPPYVAFKHQATINPNQSHLSYVHHASTYNTPNAILIVTANSGTNGPYNPHPFGVLYRNKKWAIFNQDKKAIPAKAKFNILVVEKDAFIHQVTSESLDEVSLNKYKKAYRSYIIHPSINNNPNARIFITQNWGIEGPSNKHTVGMRYHTKKGHWMVQNLNGAELPLGAKFNIYIDDSSNSFVYETTQITQNRSAINHPKINGQANTLIFTTSTSAIGEWTNWQETSVWFANKKWHIYNQNKKPFLENSRYNMLVIKNKKRISRSKFDKRSKKNLNQKVKKNK